MSEIYWLTRLNGVHTFLAIAAFISLLGTFFTLMYYLMDDGITEAITKVKGFFIAFVISMLGIIFTPTTEELLLIYGLGSVKEYVESNDKAKELPDKAIEALDKYLDIVNEDLNKEKQ